MASPGSVNVERVGGLALGLGMKGGLAREETRGRFVRGGAGMVEVEGGLVGGWVDVDFDGFGAGGAAERREGLVVVIGVGFAEAGFVEVVRGVIVRLGVVLGTLRGEGLVETFLAVSAVGFFAAVCLVTLVGAVADFLVVGAFGAFASVVADFVVVVLGRGFLTGDCGSSTMVGMDSPIFSISSSRASIASTESSIRKVGSVVVNLIGDLNTMFSAKESSCLTSMVVTVVLSLASSSKQSFCVIFAGVRVSMVATNESSPSCTGLISASGVLWTTGSNRGVFALADNVLNARLTAFDGGVCGRPSCIGI